uniref:Kazal-like domain-containing protein n=1 Tax=Plectus sambesii TaxID=2011161 RepID=A0A914UMW0_9BILA
MSASTASLVTGGVIVPAAVFGNILGGSLSKKFKWNATGMILFALIVESSSLIFGGCFLFHCPRSEIIGVDRDANFTSFSRSMPSVTMARMEHTLNNTCNNRCSCDGSIYQPVCDTKENVAYFSPCYAGCTDSVDNKYYSNCKCLSRTKDEPSTSTTVKDGLCGDGCFWMYPFFVLFACYVCVAFSSAIPIQESELRSVPFDQRSLAFGIRWIFIRLLGTIPAPLLFGVFVDKACVVWKVDQNNKHLDCPLYNNAFLSTFIVVCGTALKVLVIISLGLAWHFSRKASKVTPETYEEQETGAAADQQCPSPKLNERF